MREILGKGRVTGLLSLLLATGTCVGQQSAGQSFEEVDHNGDGRISFDEAQRGLGMDQTIFDRADYDADGRLSLPELNQAQILMSQPAVAEPQETEPEPKLEMGKTPARATPLMSRRAGDLKGMQVDSMTDEEIGEVEKVVVDPRTNTLYAVVSVGSIVGAGTKEIAMNLEQMQLRQEELIATTVLDEDQLEELPAFDPSDFRELEDEQILGPVTGAAPSPVSPQRARTFADLDKNADGYISLAEATESIPLQQVWNFADQNGDRRIDRAEFSAVKESLDALR
jgi:Ca2+-binding EF-hand superfamily protein